MDAAVKTLTQRKAEAAAAKTASVHALSHELTEAARRLGGRFLLYGSAARGEMRWRSDVDLLLDFPDDASERAAWDVAEAACRRMDLECDARPLASCGKAFLDHVLPMAKVLG